MRNAVDASRRKQTILFAVLAGASFYVAAARAVTHGNSELNEIKPAATRSASFAQAAQRAAGARLMCESCHNADGSDHPLAFPSGLPAFPR
jgi:hypothetical protein